MYNKIVERFYIEFNGEKLFNRGQVDEWIKHNSMIWEKWNE